MPVGIARYDSHGFKPARRALPAETMPRAISCMDGPRLARDLLNLIHNHADSAERLQCVQSLKPMQFARHAFGGEITPNLAALKKWRQTAVDDIEIGTFASKRRSGPCRMFFRFFYVWTITLLIAGTAIGTLAVQRGSPIHEEIAGSDTPEEYSSRTVANILGGGDFVTRAPDGEAHATVRFPSPQSFHVIEHTYPRETPPQYKIRRAAIQWSDDGSSWNEAARGADQRSSIRFDVSHAGAHRQWRLLVLESGDASEVVLGNLKFEGSWPSFLSDIPVDLIWLSLIPALLLVYSISPAGLTRSRVFTSFAIPLVGFFFAIAFGYAPIRPIFNPDSWNYLSPLILGTFSPIQNSGYPAFLLLVEKTLTLQYLPHVQLGLASVAYVIAAWIVARIYPWRWVGAGLLLLLCFQGVIVKEAGQVHTEALFSAGLTLACAALAVSALQPSTAVLLLGAVGLSVAIAAKSVGIVLIAPAILLLRFIPRRDWLRTTAMLLAPALATYAVMAVHAYHRTDSLAPESFAGYALAGHVGWMLTGSATEHPEVTQRVLDAVKPVLAKRPDDLGRIRSRADLDAYVDYTSSEYNLLLYSALLVPVKEAFRTTQEINSYLLTLALDSIAARPGDYLFHVLAHFYGLWRDLGYSIEGPQTAAIILRSWAATTSEKNIKWENENYKSIIPPFPPLSQLLMAVQLQSQVPLAFPALWKLARWPGYPGSAAIVGLIALGLSALFFLPGRLTRLFRAEIMIALTINAYLLGTALFQVALVRYARVALPAVLLLMACLALTTSSALMAGIAPALQEWRARNPRMWQNRPRHMVRLSLGLAVFIFSILALAQYGLEPGARCPVALPLKFFGCLLHSHQILAGGLIAASGALIAGYLVWSAIWAQITEAR